MIGSPKSQSSISIIEDIHASSETAFSASSSRNASMYRIPTLTGLNIDNDLVDSSTDSSDDEIIALSNAAKIAKSDSSFSQSIILQSLLPDKSFLDEEAKPEDEMSSISNDSNQEIDSFIQSPGREHLIYRKHKVSVAASIPLDSEMHFQQLSEPNNSLKIHLWGQSSFRSISTLDNPFKSLSDLQIPESFISKSTFNLQNLFTHPCIRLSICDNTDPSMPSLPSSIRRHLTFINDSYYSANTSKSETPDLLIIKRDRHRPTLSDSSSPIFELTDFPKSYASESQLKIPPIFESAGYFIGQSNREVRLNPETIEFPTLPPRATLFITIREFSLQSQNQLPVDISARIYILNSKHQITGYYSFSMGNYQQQKIGMFEVPLYLSNSMNEAFMVVMFCRPYMSDGGTTFQKSFSKPVSFQNIQISDNVYENFAYSFISLSSISMNSDNQNIAFPPPIPISDFITPSDVPKKLDPSKFSDDPSKSKGYPIMLTVNLSFQNVANYQNYSPEQYILIPSVFQDPINLATSSMKALSFTNTLYVFIDTLNIKFPSKNKSKTAIVRLSLMDSETYDIIPAFPFGLSSSPQDSSYSKYFTLNSIFGKKSKVKLNQYVQIRIPFSSNPAFILKAEILNEADFTVLGSSEISLFSWGAQVETPEPKFSYFSYQDVTDKDSYISYQLLFDCSFTSSDPGVTSIFSHHFNLEFFQKTSSTKLAPKLFILCEALSKMDNPYDFILGLSLLSNKSIKILEKKLTKQILYSWIRDFFMRDKQTSWTLSQLVQAWSNFISDDTKRLRKEKEEFHSKCVAAQKIGQSPPHEQKPFRRKDCFILGILFDMIVKMLLITCDGDKGKQSANIWPDFVNLFTNWMISLKLHTISDTIQHTSKIGRFFVILFDAGYHVLAIRSICLMTFLFSMKHKILYDSLYSRFIYEISHPRVLIPSIIASDAMVRLVTKSIRKSLDNPNFIQYQSIFDILVESFAIFSNTTLISRKRKHSEHFQSETINSKPDEKINQNDKSDKIEDTRLADRLFHIIQYLLPFSSIPFIYNESGDSVLTFFLYLLGHCSESEFLKWFTTNPYLHNDFFDSLHQILDFTAYSSNPIDNQNFNSDQLTRIKNFAFSAQFSIIHVLSYILQYIFSINDPNEKSPILQHYLYILYHMFCINLVVKSVPILKNFLLRLIQNEFPFLINSTQPVFLNFLIKALSIKSGNNFIIIKTVFDSDMENFQTYFHSRSLFSRLLFELSFDDSKAILHLLPKINDPWFFNLVTTFIETNIDKTSNSSLSLMDSSDSFSESTPQKKIRKSTHIKKTSSEKSESTSSELTGELVNSPRIQIKKSSRRRTLYQKSKISKALYRDDEDKLYARVMILNYSPDMQYQALEQLAVFQAINNNKLEEICVKVFQAALLLEYICKMEKIEGISQEHPSLLFKHICPEVQEIAHNSEGAPNYFPCFCDTEPFSLTNFIFFTIQIADQSINYKFGQIARSLLDILLNIPIVSQNIALVQNIATLQSKLYKLSSFNRIPAPFSIDPFFEHMPEESEPKQNHVNCFGYYYLLRYHSAKNPSDSDKYMISHKYNKVESSQNVQELKPHFSIKRAKEQINNGAGLEFTKFETDDSIISIKAPMMVKKLNISEFEIKKKSPLNEWKDLYRKIAFERLNLKWVIQIMDYEMIHLILLSTFTKKNFLQKAVAKFNSSKNQIPEKYKNKIENELRKWMKLIKIAIELNVQHPVSTPDFISLHSFFENSYQSIPFK